MAARVVIAAGGTGGHLFPAQRIAEALKADGFDVLFLGSGLETSPFFQRNKFPYHTVKACGWKGLKPGALWRLFYHNIVGVKESLQLLKSYKPDAVIGFGSFHTLPVMIAVRLWGGRLFLYEANSIPGKVVRWFSNYAEEVAVQFPHAGKYLSREVVQVAMSGKFSHIEATKEKAQQYFGLQSGKTLLIAGGSQGAEAINRFICDAVAGTGWQVIHLLGKSGTVEQYQEDYGRKGVQACVKNFEERMDLAWAAADLFLGRSGASTIAEIIQTCTPAVLIPYPYASENHQTHNAQLVVDAGGGMIIPQSKATAGMIREILNKDMYDTWHTSLKKYIYQQTLPTLEQEAKHFLGRTRITV